MRLTPSDPDLATICARIKRGDLDLQPDFQRQEVWTDKKQKRLIDTILRDWHVPPIHIVENINDSKQEVLDGQQRLAAIRDFVECLISVDGTIDPPDEEINSLHGIYYDELPDKFRRRFDRYALRVITLTDYRPEEPGELFFRLNQQSALTAPEQRNAFFGPARDQVRSLVRGAEELGLSKPLIGFSNSRMAYDDVFARFCEALESQTLRKKLSATAITDRYRSGAPYNSNTVHRAEKAIQLLIQSLLPFSGSIALNKASCHSWLCFLASGQREAEADFPKQVVGKFLMFFETSRALVRTGLGSEELDAESWSSLSNRTLFAALRAYNDRASSRVADTSSVLVRDFVTWLTFASAAPVRAHANRYMDAMRRRQIQGLQEKLDVSMADSQAVDNLAWAIESSNWGSIL